MDFVTIDFETANSSPASACEIGLSFVDGGRVVETKSWLIKPKLNFFHYFNTRIHGIAAHDVENEPEFDALWPEWKELLSHKIVLAHNASFDMTVLRRSLELYELELPPLQYACTVQLARRIWPGHAKYDLKSLCDRNNIQFRHHRAGADSEATALMMIEGMKHMQVGTIEELFEKLDFKTHPLKPQISKSKTALRKSRSLFPVPDYTKVLAPIFKNRKVVITGVIPGINRHAAENLLLNAGALLQNQVDAQTEILIYGNGPASQNPQSGRKWMEAKKLEESGACIEFFSAQKFKDLLK